MLNKRQKQLTKDLISREIKTFSKEHNNLLKMEYEEIEEILKEIEEEN